LSNRAGSVACGALHEWEWAAEGVGEKYRSGGWAHDQGAELRGGLLGRTAASSSGEGSGGSGSGVGSGVGSGIGSDLGSGIGSGSLSGRAGAAVPPLRAFVSPSFFHPLAFAGEASRGGGRATSGGDGNADGGSGAGGGGEGGNGGGGKSNASGGSSAESGSISNDNSNSRGPTTPWGICIAIAPLHCSCSPAGRPLSSPSAHSPAPIFALLKLLHSHFKASASAVSKEQSRDTSNRPSPSPSPTLSLLLSLDRHRAEGLLLKRAMRAVACRPSCRASVTGPGTREVGTGQRNIKKQRAGEGEVKATEGAGWSADDDGMEDDDGDMEDVTDSDSGTEGDWLGLEELSGDFEVDLVQTPPAVCSLAHALPAAARRQLLSAYSPRFFPPGHAARLLTPLSSLSAEVADGLGQHRGAKMRQGDGQPQQQQQQGEKEQGCGERVREACMRLAWQQEVQRSVQFVHAVRQCAASNPRFVLFLQGGEEEERGGAGERGGARGRRGVGGRGGVRVREGYDVAMERFLFRELRGRDWGVVSLAGRARPSGNGSQADGESVYNEATMLRPVRGVQALLLRGEESQILPLLTYVEDRFLEAPLEDLLISFCGRSNKSAHLHHPPLFWQTVGGGKRGKREEGWEGLENGLSLEEGEDGAQEEWAVENPFASEVKEPIRTAPHPPPPSLEQSMLVTVHGGEVQVGTGVGGAVSGSLSSKGGGKGKSRAEDNGDGGVKAEGAGNDVSGSSGGSSSGGSSSGGSSSGGAQGKPDRKRYGNSTKAAGHSTSGSPVQPAAVVLSPGSFACWVTRGSARGKGEEPGEGGGTRGGEEDADKGRGEVDGGDGLGKLRGSGAGGGDYDYSDAASPEPAPYNESSAAAAESAPEATEGVTAEGVIRGVVVLESPLTEQGAVAWTMVAPSVQQGGRAADVRGDGAVRGQTEATATREGKDKEEEKESRLLTIPISGRLFLPGIKDQPNIWPTKSFDIDDYTTVDAISATTVSTSTSEDGSVRLAAPSAAVRGTVQMEGALTWTDSDPGHARLAAEGVVLIERREGEEGREEERVWGAWRDVGVWGGGRAGGDGDRVQGAGGADGGSQEKGMRPSDADGRVGAAGSGQAGGRSTRRGGNMRGSRRAARFVFDEPQAGAHHGRLRDAGMARQLRRDLLGTSVDGDEGVGAFDSRDSDGSGGSSTATATSGSHQEEPTMLQLSCDGMVEYTVAK
ncbi:hypothetical protein CLOM_g15615, partial [Closterium sp. NIES-68]